MKVKFSDVVRRANTKEDKDNTDKVFYVGGEHIDSNEVLITKRGIIAGSTIGPMFYFGFKAGQVLFVSRNPHLRKAGMVDFDGICSEKTFVLETIDENILLQRYLPFILQSDHFWSYAESNKSGSVNFFINWSTLAKYEFELPSIAKQKELSDLLWAINDTKLAYRKMLIATDELVKSQFIARFGLPDTNTMGFRLGTIGDVVKDIHYGTSAKASEDGRYTYIRMNNITYDGKLDLSDTKRITIPDADAESFIVRQGDILFNRTNSRDLVGKTCVFDQSEPMIIAGYIIRLRMNGLVLPEYLSQFMNTRYAKKLLLGMAKGAVGQANINAKELQDIAIIIPPIDIQQDFLGLIRQSDKSKFEIEQAITSIDKLYRSIIAENLG